MPAPSYAAGVEGVAGALRDFAAHLIAEAGDNQSQAADRIGVHRSTLSRALSDPHMMTAILARVVEAYSGLSVSQRTEFVLG